MSEINYEIHGVFEDGVILSIYTPSLKGKYESAAWLSVTDIVITINNNIPENLKEKLIEIIELYLNERKSVILDECGLLE